MKTENYYEEIEHLIKKNEINKKYRNFEENYDKVDTYWHIGRLITEAQGGSFRAKYGDQLIKKWSNILLKKYGKNYSERNLKYFRKFYQLFSKGNPAGSHLAWTHFRCLLSIKNEDERNYYINRCIKNNLSKRELEKEIKSNSYERLINKPKNVEIIIPNKKFDLMDNMQNPIILEIDKNREIKTESDLELIILSTLKLFFRQLGEGFTFMDNQYKIIYNNKNYFIDILLFNYKLNCFVVVELKLRELKYEDKAQIEFYINLIDKTLKEANHNKTIGIIITKEQDKLIANFIISESIIPLTYKIDNKKANKSFK